MLSRDELALLRKRPVGRSGNRLAYAMNLADLTQVQLGELTGFTQSYISRVANGAPERLPLETARTFSRSLGVPLDDLFPSREAVAS